MPSSWTRFGVKTLERLESRELLAAGGSGNARTGGVLRPGFALVDIPAAFSRQAGEAILTIARTGRGDTVKFSTMVDPGNLERSAQPGVQYLSVDRLITFPRGRKTATIAIPLIPGQDGSETTKILVELEAVGGSRFRGYGEVTLVNRPDVDAPGILSSRLNRKGDRITGVTVQFDEAMDPISVADPRRYVLIDAHQSGVLDFVASLAFRSRSQGNLTFRGGSYDADSRTLVLTLHEPVENLGRYHLGALWNDDGRGKQVAPTDVNGNPLPRFSVVLDGQGSAARPKTRPAHRK